MRSGEYALAIEDLGAAISLDPGYLSAYVNRGVAAHGLGDHAAAVADFDHAIGVDPERLDAYAHRARALTLLGRDDRAAEDVAFLESRGVDAAALAAELGELRASR